MSTSTPSGASLGKRVAAVLVLCAAAFLLFKVVLGFLAFVGTILLVIAVIAAVVWAMRVL